MKQHHYSLQTIWTGNKGAGTDNYRSYDRSHTICINGKPEILASSDPAFRGDPTRYNPEELLLASLSSCHMLWYLHLCAEGGVVVTNYSDEASGTMVEDTNGSGHFTQVLLKPKVTVAAINTVERATQLHEAANKMCFIANSVKFPVLHDPNVIYEPESQVSPLK